MKLRTLAIHWTKIWYLILTLLIIVFLACGDSDDGKENQPVKPTTQTEEPGDEIIEAEEVVVDFAAEEDKIRQLFLSHAVAVSEKGADEIMEYWIERNTKDVFMTQCIAGAVMLLQTWKGIKNSWAPTFQLLGQQPMTVTIDQVGIDKRGQQATLNGDYKWYWVSGKVVAAFEKDKKGEWKIRAIDLCEQKMIKEIQTPQPE